MTKGYIYILTNKSFHKSDLVKIGYATDVNKRAKELSNTSVPEPFEIYATYEVPFDSKMPDKALHNLIQKLNPSLRITANREFFEIEPWDAYELLESMAIIHNRQDKLVRYVDNTIGSDVENEQNHVYTLDELFSNEEAKRLFEKIKEIVKEIDESITVSPTKYYASFKMNKKKNVIAIWPKEGWIEVILRAKLGTIKDDSNTIYDISNRLWSASQYALRVDDSSDWEQVRDLIQQTYNQL